MNLRLLYGRIAVLVALCTPVCPSPSGADQPQSGTVAPHPLDPLTAAEIDAAAGLLSAAPWFPPDGLFATIVLKEPDKNDVLAHKPGSATARRAFAVILDRKGNRTMEAVVDPGASRVDFWRHVKGVQPVVLEAEYETLVRVVKADPRWQDAMRQRGVTDLDAVQIDYWAVGQVAPRYQTRRLLRAVSYFKGESINFYGRPIEGVGVLVDMNAERVVEFVDTGAVPLPPASQELDGKSTGARTAPRALTIAQPDGPSFTIAGQEIRWQNWRFRYTMHPREGLVLHTVGYEDAGRLRPILYRASVSEMAVPYGDPDRNWRWRSAFDVGEYGMGRLASPIEPNMDAPSHATLIDVTFAGDNGRSYVLPRAVGLYERDGGLLWKHYESYSKTNESRRARQLVIFFIATIGNYDYSLSWIFHQDGVLELDAGLTGIMLPKGVRDVKAAGHRAGPTSGHLVSANIVAPHHQHFFNFRLDFDVDGPVNAVREMNTRALPAGGANPSLNGMVMEETELGSEALAQRQMSMASARTWSVVNPAARNALGHHPSYILIPGVNAIPYVAPASPMRRRAGFVNRHFWATRYDADEMYAAGAYPNQSLGGAGLAKWAADNEPLSGQDVVVWYTMGVTHVPRPEEWPVMPVTHVGFKMIPGGFFSRNPALDVPR
jgi:primary-amine oxidase